MTKERMLQILEKYKNLIENKDFDKFYAEMYNILGTKSDIGLFTQLFLKSNINPLDYLTYLPSHYAYNNKDIKNIVLKNEIDYINPHAFENCVNLINVQLSLDTITLDNSAFNSCINLENINLHNLDKLKTIKYDVFGNCKKLREIKLPKNLKYIYAGAFYGCENLHSIYIPKSVKTILNQAFDKCDNLSDIYYEGSEEQGYNLIDNYTLGINLSKVNMHYNYKY